MVHEAPLLTSGRPPRIDSAVVVERYKYDSKVAVVGLSDGLYVALSDNGRDWNWDQRPVLNIPPPQRDRITKVIRAYRRGEEVVVEVLREVGATSRTELAILDGRNPWRLLAYLTDESAIEPILATPRPALERVAQNPIVVPRSKNDWEAFTTLNPAAFFLNNQVHLLYRAQGFDYVSSVGYATSRDGIHLQHRHDRPIYSDQILSAAQRQGKATHQYASGGGLGGVEDPRTTVLDQKVYMTYVAFDGITPPYLSLTSIEIEDFLKRRWRWRAPVRMSRPGLIDKSGVIFPQKIRGKYVVMHRVFPNIQIDYRDDLEFEDGNFLQTKAEIPASTSGWDSRKIGAGPPPMLTDEGWLLIYYGVDDQSDDEYCIGAMLLDRDCPEKVLYRSIEPILAPSAHYEMTGFKPKVLYPCGAIIKEDMLFVYYGASDQYVCVATAPVADLLAALKTYQPTNLSVRRAERPLVSSLAQGGNS